ncbi:hypothetical protein FBULB1_11458 [Fusarium bulbicola]|nr:hypothetical protein FBULB1_11458 [Fusarium bulbicola]
MPPDGNSNTKASGANQSGNLPRGGSTKNREKSGNNSLKKDRDDMAEYGNPETTYTMPIAMDDYPTGRGVKKATKYRPVYGSKPKPRDTTGNNNTTTDLDTGEFEPLGKKVNVEGRGAELQARHNAERERQQSYSVLKWNYDALRANEMLSKSQEDKPKLLDGKRAPLSETKQNRVFHQLEVHPDYIPNDSITMYMAEVTLQHQRETQDRYNNHISGFAAGRQNFLDDSVNVIQTRQKSTYTSQNESQGGGSEANLGNSPFRPSENYGLNNITYEEF